MNRPIFIYDKYELSGSELDFHYSYKSEDGSVLGQFREVFKLPIAINPSDPITAYILQQLHIVVGTSYYKSLLGEIELPYKLDESEAAYWNTVYDEGLGEFEYVNQIASPIRPFNPAGPNSREPISITNKGALLGVGGGKDSATSGELLKHLGIETVAMDVATASNRGQAEHVMALLGFPELRVERYVDTRIIEFTEEYAGYHGHIPLSAILAWLGVLLAHARGLRYVAMANEAASSVGNVKWNGRTINHQWSKSLDFEKLTQQLIHSHISPDIWYFSPIRPYSSLAVIELFVKLGEKYFTSFTSCNLVLRIDPAARPGGRWCTRCAKCLSSWLLLSLWLDEKKLTEIFGKNLYDDASLGKTLRELVGLEGNKPLDCVGTTEELRAATRRSIERYGERPLFRGVNAGQLPGPDAEALVRNLGPNVIPMEIAPQLLELVSNTLA